MARILALDTHDIRFPTSGSLTDPATVSNGRYRAPARPGNSMQMRPESIATFTYPAGPAWSGAARAERAGL